MQVFDVTRKQTYQHLTDWYKELREFCETIPCIVVRFRVPPTPYTLHSPQHTSSPLAQVANKIDIDPRVTSKEFKFAKRNNLPFFYVSAADGTNVVAVTQSCFFGAPLLTPEHISLFPQTFEQSIKEAIKSKESDGDFVGDVMNLLEEVGASLTCRELIFMLLALAAHLAAHLVHIL
jgi:Rab-like protein 2